MGKHSWDHQRHGPRPRAARTSWHLVFAVPICMTFVFIGVDMYQHPARCDHQPTGWGVGGLPEFGLCERGVGMPRARRITWTRVLHQ